jgi:hypothetical protein
VVPVIHEAEKSVLVLKMTRPFLHHALTPTNYAKTLYHNARLTFPSTIFAPTRFRTFYSSINSTLDVDVQDLERSPSSSQRAPPANQSGPSLWRTLPIASIHDAVQRFTASGGEEKDFSLFVDASPGLVYLESLGAVLETLHPPLGGVSRKGQERAVDDGDEDLTFILDRHHVQDKEKQLDDVQR